MKSKILIVVAIMLTVFVGKAEARVTNAFASYNNGVISWNINQADLVDDFENYWNIEISSMVIDYSPGNPGLLRVYSIDSLNNPDNFAIEIEGIPNLQTGLVDIYFEEYQGPIPGIKDLFAKHTCTGSPCNNCEYNRGSGCTCLSSPTGVCNHSVTYPSWCDVGVSVVTVLIAIVGLCL